MDLQIAQYQPFTLNIESSNLMSQIAKLSRGTCLCCSLRTGIIVWCSLQILYTVLFAAWTMSTLFTGNAQITGQWWYFWFTLESLLSLGIIVTMMVLIAALIRNAGGLKRTLKALMLFGCIEALVALIAIDFLYTTAKDPVMLHIPITTLVALSGICTCCVSYTAMKELAATDPVPNPTPSFVV